MERHRAYGIGGNMIAIPMGSTGDYHLYPEHDIKHIIVLRNIITFYMTDIQLCITCYTEKEMHHAFRETTFLSKENFAHFKASLLENAIGFNPLLCSKRRDRSAKVRLPRTVLDEDRSVGIGIGFACCSNEYNNI